MNETLSAREGAQPQAAACEETISRQRAVEEVRGMAAQFAELYFAFVCALRDELGEARAMEVVQRVLYRRARERAGQMVERAREMGVARTPENITRTSDVPYLGWVPALGRDHCPYGMVWNARIAEAPWFRPFARLYCDVTDTTIAEVFTGDHSHQLYENVVLGDERCARRYFPDERVAQGARTYE